jgi:hypothetical protein
VDNLINNTTNMDKIIAFLNYDDNSTDATINGLVVKEVNLISI